MRKLENKLPGNLLSLLPSRYPIIGGAVIVYLREELKPYKHEIGSAILTLLKTANSVWIRIGPTTGYTREPQLECVAGDCNPIVLHRELKTYFKIDVSRLTFSPGNAGERQKLVNIVKENEIVVDMFACCGNLSLPIAKLSKPRLVFGIEINPYAFSFLIENILLNKVEDRYIPILGDNRIATPENIADHVLLGFFKVDRHQLIAATNAIKKHGTLHLHFLSRKGREKEELTKIIEQLKDIEVKVRGYSIEKVKSYAPNIFHYVARINVIK